MVSVNNAHEADADNGDDGVSAAASKSGTEVNTKYEYMLIPCKTVNDVRRFIGSVTNYESLTILVMLSLNANFIRYVANAELPIYRKINGYIVSFKYTAASVKFRFYPRIDKLLWNL